MLLLVVEKCSGAHRRRKRNRKNGRKRESRSQIVAHDALHTTRCHLNGNCVCAIIPTTQFVARAHLHGIHLRCSNNEKRRTKQTTRDTSEVMKWNRKGKRKKIVNPYRSKIKYVSLGEPENHRLRNATQNENQMKKENKSGKCAASAIEIFAIVKATPITARTKLKAIH